MYRATDLHLPRLAKKRLFKRERVPLYVPNVPDLGGSGDFMSDTLWNERCFRSDSVNNCTWYFEPTMGDNHDARTRNQAMDRQTRSGVEPVNYKGQATIEEASREYGLTPSEIERWLDDAEADKENTLKANPKDVAEQYEKQLSDLKGAYGEVML